MKRYLISLAFVILANLFYFPNNANADFNFNLNTTHDNVSIGTSLRQQGSSNNTLTEGYLAATFNFSNIRVRFNPNIFSGSTSCIGEPGPWWDTYFNVYHSIDFTTSDYIDGGLGPTKSGRMISVIFQIKLSQYGVPLFDSSNPGWDIRFEEWNTQDWITTDYKLRDYFEVNGQQLISKPFVFPIYAGEEFIVTEKTYVQEYFKCPKANLTGGYSIGKDIESNTSLIVDKKMQKIIANIPSQVNYANKIERLSFFASSKLPVQVMEKTPKICLVNNDLLYLKSTGTCELELSQSGNQHYSAAPTILKKIKVISSSQKKGSTIICIKGNSTLTVTGIDPLCPAGYRKK